MTVQLVHMVLTLWFVDNLTCLGKSVEEVRPFHKGIPNRNKNVFFRALPLPSNNDYDNDGSDNCEYNFGTFDNFGVRKFFFL